MTPNPSTASTSHTATDPATLNTRRGEFLTAIDTLLDIHQDWQATDNPELSQSLVTATEDAIDVCTSGDMPADLLPLYSRMNSLNEAWTEAVMRADDSDHIQTKDATTFWKALDAVRHLRTQAEDEDTAEFRPLESVATLTRQNVPDPQICWIYRAAWPEGARTGPGLWDWRKNGPMLSSLERERATPGSVIPSDFIPWYAAQKKIDLERRKAAAARSEVARQQRIAKLHKPCPEPLAQLIDEGVDIDQIARMKKTTAAAIRQQCQAEGLPMPKEPEALTSDYNPKPNEAQERIAKAGQDRSSANAKPKRGRPPKAAKAKLVEEDPEDEQDTDVDDPDDFGDDWQERADVADIADAEDVELDLGEGGEQETTLDEPVTEAERLIASYMGKGGKPKEVAQAIRADGGPDLPTRDVSAIMGKLKGDPERMKAAMAE